MDYVKELRLLVGQRPLIVVGAAVLILDEQQRLLLQHRTDNHCWGIPGGAMKPGETIEATARREALEETGLIVNTLTCFGIFSGPELFYQYPNGDQVYNVSVVYIATDPQGDMRPNHEASALRCFHRADLPQELSPPNKPILEKFAQTYDLWPLEISSRLQGIERRIMSQNLRHLSACGWDKEDSEYYSHY